MVVGVVRKQLGVTFLGETYSDHLIFGEIESKGLSPDVSTLSSESLTTH